MVTPVGVGLIITVPRSVIGYGIKDMSYVVVQEVYYVSRFHRRYPKTALMGQFFKNPSAERKQQLSFPGYPARNYQINVLL